MITTNRRARVTYSGDDVEDAQSTDTKQLLDVIVVFYGINLVHITILFLNQKLLQNHPLFIPILDTALFSILNKSLSKSNASLANITNK